MTPRQVGPYRLDSLLGSGGTGEVYQAYDTHRDRRVALKLLPAAFSGDPEYLKRFQRESQVAARLREPHIIPIHDFGDIGGQLFIDMRLVDGHDIGTMLATGMRITPHRAVYLIGQVAEALDAAHADDLVHRDIKPSNLLVTSSDFVYVVDFGIARSIGAQQTALAITAETIGTLHYMAPERLVGHEVDGRADVYSLACVLHECLTGTPPFAGDLPALMYAQLYTAPPPASGLVPGVPPAVDAVIARGMAKDPKDRFATAGELAAAARHALLNPAPAPAPVPAPAPPAPPAPPMTELPAPASAESPAPAVTEAAVPVRATAPVGATRPDVANPPAPQAAPAVTTWQDVASPPVQKTEPAGNRYARSARETPTQTVLAADVGDFGGMRPPANMPQVVSPGPGEGYLPPGEGYLPPGDAPAGPPRGPARRRLGLLVLVIAAAVAVPFVIVLMLSKKPATSAPPAPNTGGATGTSAAGSAGGGSAARLPTADGTIQVGQNPSYIQVAPNGKFAYVADPGAGAIAVLNTATNLVTGHIKIPQGPPQSLSFSPDSRTAYVSVYTTNGRVHFVAFIDTATSKVTSTVAADNITPGPSTTSPDGRYLYVPNHNTALTGAHVNAVDVIDTATRKLIDHIAVPANPHWVAYGQDGRIYTTDHMSARVTVVNAATNSIVTEIQVGETPHSETLSPDGRRLAVTSFAGNVVYLINTKTDRMIKQIPVGRNPVGIAYSRDGKFLYTVNNADNTVSVIDTAGYRVVGAVKTGKAPTSISVLPDGSRAYVTDENDGTIQILNLSH